ncbi:MAG: hypothetical protein KC964_25015, partial [Candidatus Omnitrophica bacterium]|nr:hypothetical protein [Candidatus Omnitrophota bacterium]
MRSTRTAGIWVMFWVLLLLPELACSAPTADEPAPEIITVKMKAVEGGESEVKADDCRRIVVGPGINEVDPFPGWGGFVGWESPIRLKSGEWLVG